MKRSATCNRRQRRALARHARRHGVSAHVLALAVAVALWEIPPSVIEEPGGPIPVQEALPGFAPTIVKIAKPGIEYTWNTVRDWWQAGFSAVTSLWGGVASLGYDAVASMIGAAEGIAQEAWSSMINHVQAFAATGLADVFDLATTIEGYFLTYTDYLTSQIDDLFNLVEGIDGYVATQIWDAVQGIDQTISDSLGNLATLLETWAIDNILDPALAEIEAVAGNIENVAQRVFDDSIVGIDGIVAELGNLLNAETLIRAGEIASLLTAIGAIEAWLQECGDPMCATFGPGTDFGKLWKALQSLLGILSGLAIASLTESEVEQIAHAYDAVAGQPVDSFVSTFVEGGGTLGAAGAGVLGELTTVGGDVLHVLGVPGF